MGQITKTACDQCGKEVADRHDELGWIRLSGANISVSLGRAGDGGGRLALPNKSALDFCKLECMIAWLCCLAKKEATKINLAVNLWGGQVRTPKKAKKK